MKLIKADVEFKVDNKPVKFCIIHNMPEVFGLSFEYALDNWLARTNKFTAKSLCNYIKSKNTGHIVMTEEEYNKL
jgi:hypothetical protein